MKFMRDLAAIPVPESSVLFVYQRKATPGDEPGSKVMPRTWEMPVCTTDQAQTGECVVARRKELEKRLSADYRWRRATVRQFGILVEERKRS
jgi:hypothetical protein